MTTGIYMMIIFDYGEYDDFTQCAGKEKDEGCQLAVEPEHIIVHPDL